MFELVLQTLAYSGVGLAVLVIGFIALDLLTPGHLGTHVMEGNRGAGLISGTGLVSLGRVDQARGQSLAWRVHGGREFQDFKMSEFRNLDEFEDWHRY